jgi:hypothetical protein
MKNERQLFDTALVADHRPVLSTADMSKAKNLPQKMQRTLFEHKN